MAERERQERPAGRGPGEGGDGPGAGTDRRRAVRAWCLYDAANSAFATTVMAALMPPFFRTLAERGGMAPVAATAAWAYTTAIALVLIALLSPLAGAIADALGRRRRLLGAMAAAGSIATVGLALPAEGGWLAAAIVYVTANVAFALSIVYYESLLVHVAAPGDFDRVSTRGYAYGYAGGGLLLLVNAAWIVRPGLFGMPSQEFAVRASLASAGLWWGVWTIFALRGLPEPGASPATAAGAQGAVPPRAASLRGAVRSGWTRLLQTAGRIRRHRQAGLLLLAYWLYNDGIGTIIKMATAYGHELGIGMPQLVSALLLTQAVGVPGAVAMGRLAGRFGPRPVILGGLAVYAAISVGAFFLRTSLHFHLLAVAVGLVQGGTQALSRSLFAAMTPAHRAAEFFGFYGASGRIAGVAGPLIFAIVGQATGQSRLGILSLVVFFILGGALLWRVNVPEGVRQAHEVEMIDDTGHGAEAGPGV